MQNVSGKIISGKLENPYPERSAPMQRIILAPAACQTRQQTSVFHFLGYISPSTCRNAQPCYSGKRLQNSCFEVTAT